LLAGLVMISPLSPPRGGPFPNLTVTWERGGGKAA